MISSDDFLALYRLDAGETGHLGVHILCVAANVL